MEKVIVVLSEKAEIKMIKLSKEEEHKNNYGSLNGFLESKEYFTLTEDALEHFLKDNSLDSLEVDAVIVDGHLFKEKLNRFRAHMFDEHGVVKLIHMELLSYDEWVGLREVTPEMYQKCVELLKLPSILNQDGKVNGKYKLWAGEPIFEPSNKPGRVNKDSILVDEILIINESGSRTSLIGYLEIQQLSHDVIMAKTLSETAQVYKGGFQMFDQNKEIILSLEDVENYNVVI